MIVAAVVYAFIFLVDWGSVKTEKNDRRLFLSVCIIGAVFLSLIIHGVKIPSPVIAITNVLDFLGLHY